MARGKATRRDAPWTEQELSRLGKEPDSVLAKRIGRTVREVVATRESRRIRLPGARQRWTAREIKLLGTLSDSCLPQMQQKVSSQSPHRRTGLKSRAGQHWKIVGVNGQDPSAPSSDGGSPQRVEDLLPLVYSELRRLAAAQMARQPPGQTLQPTALVHEAFLRLSNSGREEWANRAHFFAAAAQAMRQILVENARRKRALRHGGGQQRMDIGDVPVAIEVDDEKILEVDEALELLDAEDAAKAQVVKLRYFVGLNHEEIAEMLGLSEKTVRRYWAYAKVWLYRHIERRRGK